MLRDGEVRSGEMGAKYVCFPASVCMLMMKLCRAARKFQKKDNVVAKLVSLLARGPRLAWEDIQLTHEATIVREALQAGGSGAVPEEEQDGHRCRHTRASGRPDGQW